MKNKKIIWICGIPNSGKTVLGLRLIDELNFAQKETILLDDAQLKYVKYGKHVGKVIKLLKAEYNIIISPFPQILPRRPDLIIWCKCPIEECVRRDKVKTISDSIYFTEKSWERWKEYYVEADLILNTYDPRRKTEENIEICWQELKRKMEELFGDYEWRVHPNNQPNWYRPESGFQNSR